jgi:hypothetical protein
MIPDEEEEDFTGWNQGGVCKEERKNFGQLAPKHDDNNNALDYDWSNPERHRDKVGNFHRLLRSLTAEPIGYKASVCAQSFYPLQVGQGGIGDPPSANDTVETVPRSSKVASKKRTIFFTVDLLESAWSALPAS